MRYRKDIGRFLNARSLTGRGAEIGVEAGAFSRQVLDAWQGRRLDLVDPWAPQPPLEYEDACNVPAERHEQNLRATRERLKPHEGCCNILRMTSLEAAATHPDAALDFAYIDANHKYGHVRADLAAWWPKVKAGGLVAGSNYFDGIVNESVVGREVGRRRLRGRAPAPGAADVRRLADVVLPQALAGPTGRGETDRRADRV